MGEIFWEDIQLKNLIVKNTHNSKEYSDRFRVMNKHKDLHKDASFDVDKTFLFYDSGPTCKLIFDVWEIDQVGLDDQHKEETTCEVGERTLDI